MAIPVSAAEITATAVLVGIEDALTRLVVLAGVGEHDLVHDIADRLRVISLTSPSRALQDLIAEVSETVESWACAVQTSPRREAA